VSKRPKRDWSKVATFTCRGIEFRGEAGYRWRGVYRDRPIMLERDERGRWREVHRYARHFKSHRRAVAKATNRIDDELNPRRGEYRSTFFNGGFHLGGVPKPRRSTLADKLRNVTLANGYAPAEVEFARRKLAELAP
jgi:hypothetical protein